MPILHWWPWRWPWFWKRSKCKALFCLHKGIDCSSNPDYPQAFAGQFHQITKGGKIGGSNGINVEANDSILCLVSTSSAGDHATVGKNWMIIQGNLDVSSFVAGILDSQDANAFKTAIGATGGGTVDTTALEADINSNTTAIGTLTSDVASNTSAISALTSDVASNTSAIGTLTSDVASNTSTIGTLTSDVASNTSAIGTLTSDVASNTSAIGTLTSDVASNTSAIGTLTSDVAANTAKETNATHTGDVTGSTALTVDKSAITGKSPVDPSAGDFLLGSDASDSDNLKKIDIGQLVSGGLAVKDDQSASQTVAGTDLGKGKLITLSSAASADSEFTLPSTSGLNIFDGISFYNNSDFQLKVILADSNDKLDGITTERTLLKGQGILSFYPLDAENTWASK